MSREQKMKMHQLQENELTFRNELKTWENKLKDEKDSHQRDLDDMSQTI